MSITQTVSPTNTPPKHEIIFPQGEFWSDEPPLESNLHLTQIILLIKCLEWLWQDRKDYFATGNLTIYYSPNQKKSEFFRGPDFFVVLGTTRNQNRKSWVVWQEDGKYPNVIIEILSDSTAKTDREEKKEIYQDTFRTPDYFWFDPYSLEFQGFTLISGKYQEIKPNENGCLWSEQLGLYLGIYEDKLRYFSPNGELIPTPEEANLQERQQKELALQQQEYERQQKELALQQQEYERQQKELALQQQEYERQQKELALKKIEELTAKLRELGINSD
ncbi:Uma2 family endonuclease [Crocosphaera sp. XPORK-15E]|uniref:Uma2 family endonuclease n=1 Tax=Crocosphaera sp. XPORK-15E TaxID=3110247 RepID=UPI002B1F67B9|nr:Uma2 family endonuclease [Crocosphaera sp. XPORK-15E]MEA5534095.1 Uma2 family endonuclease [Crocosphaera sp. XPORK-15E]